MGWTKRVVSVMGILREKHVWDRIGQNLDMLCLRGNWGIQGLIRQVGTSRELTLRFWEHYTWTCSLVTVKCKIMAIIYFIVAPVNKMMEVGKQRDWKLERGRLQD